ncbi:rhodanese-like domain-containing protein [Thiomicrorhabdus sp. 6S2-11]|jgi:rhodanese-related sulfurtransferase|uniref:Rhodanese-like domain-containing protein n=1 Tax=Thiomicrorhabdus marina TaxID=2818442 RepID=A0ABS3Q753_9GAMM|nr:rhodanese-like domain-containing protein [Thiomicrorhabdus marina]MBO1928086.1 rhodanese-like domain-containing protein [Thiomicrorhabdus marina]
MSKGLMDYVQAAMAEIKKVDVEQAKGLIADGYKVLDVREPGEYLTAAIPGAMNVPRGVIEPAADLNYPGANPALRDGREDNWLVVCKSGGRAALATKTLQDMGFSNVVNMVGGMDAWAEAGGATEAPSTENSMVVLKEPCL